MSLKVRVLKAFSRSMDQTYRLNSSKPKRDKDERMIYQPYTNIVINYIVQININFKSSYTHEQQQYKTKTT